SNWNLEEAVAAGKFRQDLYYRLHVLAFALPALRERPEDIGPLARGMVVGFCRKFNKGLFRIHPDVIAALAAFPSPGNIRQLENVIQRAALMSSGPELLPAHLPQAVREASRPALAMSPPHRVAGSLARQCDQKERQAIEHALAASANCRTRAAGALGISR